MSRRLHRRLQTNLLDVRRNFSAPAVVILPFQVSVNLCGELLEHASIFRTQKENVTVNQRTNLAQVSGVEQMENAEEGAVSARGNLRRNEVSISLSTCAARSRDLEKMRREVQRARRVFVLREENHRRTRSEVHADFPIQIRVALDEFRFRQENRADLEGRPAHVRRRIVSANKSVGEIFQLSRESIREKISRLPERFHEVNIVGERFVVLLIIFVVEEIIFPAGAAEVRIKFNDGHFAVDVNQIAFRVSPRPTKIFSAAVHAAEREAEVQVKIFRVVGDCQPRRNFFRREQLQQLALNRKYRSQIFFRQRIVTLERRRVRESIRGFDDCHPFMEKIFGLAKLRAVQSHAPDFFSVGKFVVGNFVRADSLPHDEP